MATTSVSFRIDSDLKKQFEEFCDDVGLTMTTAFTVFVKRALREYRIPFDVAGDIPNEETLAAFDEVERMIQDPTLGKTYTSAREMMEDLLK